MRRLLAVAASALLLSPLAACSSDDGDVLTVYSGRNENLVRPILEQFADASGIDVRVRYGDTSELTPTLLEEGDNTRADVFFSQDAGALAALAGEGLLAPLPADVLEDVDDRFRDPDGRWVGVTARVRVIAYNTDALDEADIPDSVFELTDPKWRGRIGIAPTNASFVAFVSALIEQVGRDRTEQWLEGLQDNAARRYDNNVLILDALANHEIEVGLVNHYYLYNEFKERPDAPVANYTPGQDPGEEGTFINIAGVGITTRSADDPQAQQLVRFLLDHEAQEFFREETAEYPLSAGVTALPQLPPLADLRTIDVPLWRLGEDLAGSVELLKEVGLT